MLQCLYEDPKSYAMFFQIFAAASRADNFENVRNKAIRNAKLREKVTGVECPVILICERNPFSAPAFVNRLKWSGMLSYNEANGLDCLSKRFERDSRFYKQQTIYLRAPPKECLSRIGKRDRPEEKPMNLSTVTELHQAHDLEFLGKALVIDASGKRAFDHETRTRITHATINLFCD